MGLIDFKFKQIPRTLIFVPGALNIKEYNVWIVTNPGLSLAQTFSGGVPRVHPQCLNDSR